MLIGKKSTSQLIDFDEHSCCLLLAQQGHKRVDPTTIFSSDIVVIDSNKTLGSFFALNEDATNDIEGWLDRYLQYREICNQYGFEELCPDEKGLSDPEDWGFSYEDYLKFPKKFTEVFQPICQNWQRWLDLSGSNPNNSSTNTLTNGLIVMDSTDKKARLCLDFPNIEALKEWFLSAQETNTIPAQATIYKTDNFDTSSVTPGKTYIVRKEGDRPEITKLL